MVVDNWRVLQATLELASLWEGTGKDAAVCAHLCKSCDPMIHFAGESGHFAGHRGLQ